jgi:formylglycine-generating enzyme required for sulfatase activity
LLKIKMPKIFISYRRDDAAYPAHSIYETLVARFGEESIFFDVDTIPIGMDFHGVLNDAVSQCDVLLAIIGDQWLTLQDENGQRRLDKEDDFVRVEIEAALARNIPIVPVLVGTALVPRREQLPEPLKPLSRRHAAEVRTGNDFTGHLERLVRGIERVVETAEQQKASAQTDAPHQEESIPTSPVVATPDSPVPEPVESLEVVTNSIGMKLALIPAGEFLMGSPDSDNGALDNGALDYEKPQHRVEITTPFCLGVYPVTQEEYEKVVGTNPSHFKGEAKRPVEKVTWFDAVEFCNRLSEQEDLEPFYRKDGDTVSIIGGNGYRLPTEAEWEYACRAGTTTPWSCGDDEALLGGFAWYEAPGNETHPVGLKQPNPWGLCDMHGNVWEWCWDWYGKYESGSVTDPLGPEDGNRRVLCGGSFGRNAWYLRSAFRSFVRPTDRGLNVGFRASRTYS